MIKLNKIYLFFLILFISGCAITLPGIAPLKETVIGGSGRDKIVVIDISGIIRDKESSNIFGIQRELRLTSRVREELDKASTDKRVKAIILRINTPGGEVTATDIVYHEIKRFKKEKNVPVVAELMDMSASGGYYIAASADKIVAHPTTITGSIGVVAFMLNGSGLMEKIGIANETIKSGRNKDVGSPLRPMTDEDRAILQNIVNTLFERFREIVKEERGFTEEKIKQISDGRIYAAKEALSLGLIDEIGYMDDTIEIAKKEAGIKDAVIVTYGRPQVYKSNIYSQIPSGINLLNIDAGGVIERLGLQFMYLYLP